MRWWLLALSLLFSSTIAHAGIGTVTDTKGNNCSIERGRARIAGGQGVQVQSMDTYLTGSCVSNIKFIDDTKVKITENSRLLIDDFVFDPKSSDAGKLALRIGQGSVRYASGQIAKNNPQRVDIRTPSASIAVRGTDFNMTVDETGQSLIILLPSCKNDEDVKQYELEENKCKVGKIEVSTLAGSVTLEEAFSGTFVFSASIAPTPPRIINTTEGNIGNSLLLVAPREIKQAIRNANGQERAESDNRESESDRVRDQANTKKEGNVEREAGLLRTLAAAASGCNPTTTVCVAWDRTDQPEQQNRGKGIAFRFQPGDHYAEVKTQGYASNTIVTITQNDSPATEIIGDGNAGANIISITQSLGIRARTVLINK